MTIGLDGGSIHGTAGERARNLRTLRCVNRCHGGWIHARHRRSVHFRHRTAKNQAGWGVGGGSIRSQESSRSCPSASLCHSTIFRAPVLREKRRFQSRDGPKPSCPVHCSGQGLQNASVTAAAAIKSLCTVAARHFAPGPSHEGHNRFCISPGAGFSEEIFGPDGSPFQRASLPTRGQSS